MSLRSFRSGSRLERSDLVRVRVRVRVRVWVGFRFRVGVSPCWSDLSLPPFRIPPHTPWAAAVNGTTSAMTSGMMLSSIAPAS